jgi:dynactin-4
LTNPLYDPIQIRLTHAHAKFSGHTIQNDNAVIHIVTPHFTINALKDAWAYDEEEDEEEADFEGTEASEEASGSVATGSGSGSGTVGRKGARMSLLAGGSVRDKGKERRDGVERKGNVSKVGVEVEVSPQARGLIEVSFGCFTPTSNKPCLRACVIAFVASAESWLLRSSTSK